MKSTPSNVGGTVGFLALKASDSGVGIRIVNEVRTRGVEVGGAWAARRTLLREGQVAEFERTLAHGQIRNYSKSPEVASVGVRARGESTQVLKLEAQWDLESHRRASG